MVLASMRAGVQAHAHCVFFPRCCFFAAAAVQAGACGSEQGAGGGGRGQGVCALSTHHSIPGGHGCAYCIVACVGMEQHLLLLSPILFRGRGELGGLDWVGESVYGEGLGALSTHHSMPGGRGCASY